MGATEEALSDIRKSVAEAITRFGVAGDVQLEGEELVLTGPGPKARVSLGATKEEWSALPYDGRQKKALDLARELVRQRRARAPASTTPQRSSLPVVPIVGVVAVIAAAAAAAAWALRSPEVAEPIVQRRPAGATGSAVERSPDEDRAARARRVCEATRSRVMRGATVSVVDVEGWVVDLVILRRGGPSMVSDPGLTAFIDRTPGAKEGRVVWKGTLGAFDEIDPFTRVVVEDASIPPSEDPTWRGVKLTFEGKYVSSYFDATKRIELVRLGNAAATRLGGAFGALYARCAHATQTHLGAWFLGQSPGDATAALVYFMGTYADSPALASRLLRPDGGALDRDHAFAAIRTATEDLDRNRVARLIGSQGGMIAGKDGARTTLRFPFGDGNRASRASRVVARSLGIGADR